MELRQLRYLLAIAEEGQFTAAAAREHVAQPALSKQIRRLEAEVDARLFRRGPKGSVLTPAGELLAERARRALAEIEAAEEELADLAGLRAGRVSIGAMQTLGPFDLTALLARFHERYPDIELVVREELSTGLEELLHSDQIDLAFLSLTDHSSVKGLELQELGTEELAAVLPPGHPCESRQRLPFSALRDDGFISFSEGAALREMLFEAAAAAGFRPRILVESTEIPRIRTMVSRGLGVALLPLTDVEAPGPPVVVKRLTGPTITRDVTLAWRSSRRLPPAARTFLELARSSSSG
jgi:DNA-binding transcriptional LysR family regulator